MWRWSRPTWAQGPRVDSASRIEQPDQTREFGTDRGQLVNLTPGFLEQCWEFVSSSQPGAARSDMPGILVGKAWK